MKKRLTNNWALKVAALLIAIFLWLFGMNFYDPIVTKSISEITVELKNADTLYNSDKVHQIEDNSNNITVRVTGRESIVRNMGAGDISATADLKEMQVWNDTYYTVPISVTSNKIDDSALNWTPQNVKIQVEDRIELDFVIKGSSNGRPANGYEVGEYKINPVKIKIAGAQSIVEKIKEVVATINVEGMSEDVSGNSDLVFLDGNGDRMDQTVIDNLEFSTADGKPTVTITAVLWSVKQEVGLDIDLNDEIKQQAAEGYRIEDEYTITPGVLDVVGSADSLDKIGGKLIINQMQEIQDEILSQAKGASEDINVEIDLKEYLTSRGLKVAGGEEANTTVMVVITIPVLPLEEGIVDLPVAKIDIQNLSEGKEVEFLRDTVRIKVSGLTDKITKISENDIKSSIDLSDYVDGSYIVALNISLPDGIEPVEENTVEIKISDSEET